MKNLLGSILLLGFYFFWHVKGESPKSSKSILVETFRATPARQSGLRRGGRGGARGAPSPKAVNLMPLFARNGFSLEGKVPGVANSGSSTSRDLLFTEPKIFHIFDLLADRVNSHLDYPMMLAENGIYGLASLDLYFDHDGNVDETRSKCIGGNGVVRGLLVQATRAGLVEWFGNEAKQIHKDQFRDQHFRADFIVTATDPSAGGYSKVGADYNFLRQKHYNPTCLEPGAVDLACAGVRLFGLIKGKSDSYKMKLEALKESTERFDELGLNGINVAIRGAQG
jgi:hypothetical protein